MVNACLPLGRMNRGILIEALDLVRKGKKMLAAGGLVWAVPIILESKIETSHKRFCSWMLDALF